MLDVRIPAWSETTSQSEDYVVGDETTVIGDEEDGGELFINLLFDTEHEWVGNQPPTARLVSPIDRARTDERPTFRWIYEDDESDLQHFFHVQVFEAFTNNIVLDSSETESSAQAWTPDADLPEGYFEWRVRVSDGFGFGPWSRRALFTTGTASFIIPSARYAVRVRVRRGNDWTDITSRVDSGTIVHNNDDAVATLDLRLLNGAEYPSLAPRIKTSPMNIVDGQYVPLLDRYNEITVDAAVSYDGSEPTEFVQMFGGYLGDNIATEDSPDGPVAINLEVRDYAKQLADDYIMGPIEFRNMWASDMIQALLDQRHAEGHLPNPIVLRVIGTDDFWVEEVTFEYLSTWDAIQSFAKQSNKDIRFMLDDTTGTFRLTYWTPNTTMVPGWIIESPNIEQETLETSDVNNRYRITVRWRDSAGKLHDTTVEALQYRKPDEPIREGLIEEGDTSLIKTEADALRFAGAVLSGLSTSPATDVLTMPFTPQMRIHDVIQVTNPRVRSDSELYALEELRLSFDAERWGAEATARESVALRPKHWLSILAEEGVKSPFKPEDIAPSRLLDTPTGVTVTTITGGIAISWDEPTNPRDLGMTIVRVRDTIDALVRTIRTQDTSVEVTSGLQAGLGYTATVQHEDIKGRLTAESAPDGAVAGKVPASELGNLTPDGRTAVVGNAVVTTDGVSDRVAVGSVGGRPWGRNIDTGTPHSLPQDQFGLWGSNAGIFMQGYLKIISIKRVSFPVIRLSSTPVAAGERVILYDLGVNVDGSIEVLPGRMVFSIAIPEVLAASGNQTGFVRSHSRAWLEASRSGVVYSERLIGPGTFNNLTYRAWAYLTAVDDRDLPAFQLSDRYWFILVEADAEKDDGPIRW